MSNVRIVIQKRGVHSDIAVIQVHGPLDTVVAYAFQEKMHALIQTGMSKFVIDLAHLEYISSAGIGVFPGMSAELRKRHGGLVFAQVPAKVYKLFEMIGLTAIFKVAETVDDALKEFESNVQ